MAGRRALLGRVFGLRGIVLVGAFAIASACSVVLRRMVWRGANALSALLVLHALIGVGSAHFLAWTYEPAVPVAAGCKPELAAFI
jgi:hypothetical protein